MPLAETLSNYIIRLRKSKGISEEQMAQRLGINRSTYHYRERNMFRNINESEALLLPFDRFFAGICRELKVDPKEVVQLVLNGDEPYENDTNSPEYVKTDDIVVLMDILLNGMKEIRQDEISKIEALRSRITDMLEELK